VNDSIFTKFLEATKNVFQLMLDLTEFSDSPVEIGSFGSDLDICIGITGDLEGEVIYHFPSETSLNIVKILSGMEFDSIDEFVTSAISEIANIISGNVLTELSKEETNCDLLPPEVKKAEEKDYEIRRACCIVTSVGNVCFDIRLNRAK